MGDLKVYNCETREKLCPNRRMDTHERSRLTDGRAKFGNPIGQSGRGPASNWSKAWEITVSSKLPQPRNLEIP